MVRGFMSDKNAYDRFPMSFEEEPKVIFECKCCGKPIYEKEAFYRVSGDVLCTDCINGCDDEEEERFIETAPEVRDLKETYLENQFDLEDYLDKK